MLSVDNSAGFFTNPMLDLPCGKVNVRGGAALMSSSIREGFSMLFPPWTSSTKWWDKLPWWFPSFFTNEVATEDRFIFWGGCRVSLRSIISTDDGPGFRNCFDILSIGLDGSAGPSVGSDISISQDFDTGTG